MPIIGICVFINLFIAWVAGKKAEEKGYSRVAFELFGICFGIVALIVVYVIRPNGDTGISKADEIMKYHQLMDQGIITRDEFEIKKRELMR